MNNHAVAYENDKGRADNLLKILKNADISDAYSEYDELSGSYTIYVKRSDVLRAESILNSYYDELAETIPESVYDAEASDNEACEEASARADSADALLYSNQDEKYRDNLSSAYTFLICGIAGIIILILYNFGLITVLNMTGASRLLFNIVAVIVFAGFIATGIFSFKYSVKLKTVADEENTRCREILEYLRKELDKDTIEASYDAAGLPEEMRYYYRNKAIGECIAHKFGEQSEEFTNRICDAYCEELFQQ